MLKWFVSVILGWMLVNLVVLWPLWLVGMGVRKVRRWRARRAPRPMPQ
jgi:hypothetical protein